MAAINKSGVMRRIYDRTEGVRLGEAREDLCFSRLENMYVDYAAGGNMPESIPGFRRIADLGETVYGVYRQKLGAGDEYLLVHAGTRLLRFPADPPSEVYEELAVLCPRESLAFSYGNDTYVIDGEQMIRVGKSAVRVLGDTDFQPYVPTILKNGEPYEQRNLLTDEFIAEWDVTNAEEYSFGTSGIRYRITGEVPATCVVAWVDETLTGEVHVPSHTRIGDKIYAVTAIGEQAFSGCSRITSVTVYPGVRRIERYAFRGCTALTRVVFPATVEVIYDRAFHGCTELSSLHIGAGLRTIGLAPFASCTKLYEVDYEGDEAMYAEIENTAALGSRIINYGVAYSGITVSFYIPTAVDELGPVFVNGVKKDFSYDPDERRVVLEYSDRSEIEGARVRIYARIAKYNYLPSDIAEDAVKKHPGCDVRALILGCRHAAVFDGRIFLSGNPDAPNTVFYSSLDGEGAGPTYFGSLDFFCDGVAGYPVVGLCTSRDSLTVFKLEDDGQGVIFSHGVAPVDDSRRRIYPVRCSLGGEDQLVGAISVGDEMLAIGEHGVYAIEETGGGTRLERHLRSLTATPVFGCGGAAATEWLGYLVIRVGESLLLGDPRVTVKRDGESGYAWYPLYGIGTYENATRVYRYAEFASGDAIVHPTEVGKIAEGVAHSYVTEDGETVYYTEEDGTKYALRRTEEMTGGDFYPAFRVVAIGERLFFSTLSGSICVFNNDMRGVAPPELSSGYDFDSGEYAREMGNRIHPSFYSFDSHAARYAVATPWDDCGEPGKRKDTLPCTLAVGLRCYGSSRVRCEVGTDGEFTDLGSFGCGVASFEELDFSSLAMGTERRITLPIKDRSRGWVEKSVGIVSEGFCSPFGVLTVSYDYKVVGLPRKK